MPDMALGGCPVLGAPSACQRLLLRSPYKQSTGLFVPACGGHGRLRAPDDDSYAKTLKGILLDTLQCFWWAIRDSNPGPTGYEPVALTN